MSSFHKPCIQFLGLTVNAKVPLLRASGFGFFFPKTLSLGHLCCWIVLTCFLPGTLVTHLVVRKSSGTNFSGTKNISVGEHTSLFLCRRDFFSS